MPQPLRMVKGVLRQPTGKENALALREITTLAPIHHIVEDEHPLFDAEALRKCGWMNV